MILAKIKLRIGDNEIEVDSRDFYVDNKTIGEVIENIAAHLQTKNVRVITGDFPVQDSVQVHALNSLENAEVYEPEFSNPTSVSPKELRGKLLILSKNYFFDQARTVPETVNELRERGWIASPLDVSKTLSKMAFNKELLKNNQGKRSYYIVKEALLAN